MVVYDSHYPSEMVFIKVQRDLALTFIGLNILWAKATARQQKTIGDGMRQG